MRMLSSYSHRIQPRARLAPTQLLWLLYALFFVAGVAQAAIVPLLPRLAGVYGLSPSETGLLLALPGLATLTVSVPAGLAADRFGSRRVTLGAGVLLAVSCLAQAAPSLGVLLAGRIAFGVAFGVVWTTGMAWLAEIDPAAAGGRLGPSVTCSSVGVMIGPAVGGVLAQHTTLALPFLLIAAVAALVVTPLIVGSDPTGARRPEVHPEDPPSPHRSLAVVLRAPEVVAAAGALTVSGAVAGVSQLLITLGLHRYGLSSSKIGLAFSLAAVCYIGVSVLVVRLGARASTLRVNAGATLVLAVALIPALSGAGAGALVLALVLTALPRATIGTIAYSLASRAREGGGGRDGLVFGTLNGAWAGAMVLTPLLAGALYQSAGARAGYLAVIVPSCVIAGGLILRARPAKTMPAGALAP
jgi:predicted MFS family arabinose efflux permease